MNAKFFCQLAERLLRVPTAPYHEHAVRAEAEKICTEHGLSFKRDEFGNVLVRLRTAGADRRALALAAHLDHPGFEIVRRLGPQTWLARFRGGVADPYFRPGLRVQLMPGSVLGSLGKRKDKKERLFEIRVDPPLTQTPSFAVWNLQEFAVRGERIHARACDDLVGCAAVLATIIELKQRRARINVIGVLSRAEEVGFHGALALAAARGLPRNALVISLETSRELPGVKMGHGVIIRVGDRASIFDSAGTRFLTEVATDLAAKDKQFHFQRALMGGGTCEATAYQEFGFQSAAVCVALGNYHNCGERNRIKAEFVNIADACSMVSFLAEAARQIPRLSELTARLPKRLHKLLRQAQPELRRTRG